MKPKTIREMMLPLDAYATVPGDSTLQEALAVLRDSQPPAESGRPWNRAVLVLDREGHVIGKLSQWAILRSLESRLLQRTDLDSLSRSGLSDAFIDDLQHSVEATIGNLDQVCRVAAHLRARDAMVPVMESIAVDASLIAAVRRLVARHAQSLLVVEAAKCSEAVSMSRTKPQWARVVGILRLSDVFEEVAGLIRDGEESPWQESAPCS